MQQKESWYTYYTKPMQKKPLSPVEHERPSRKKRNYQEFSRSIQENSFDQQIEESKD